MPRRRLSAIGLPLWVGRKGSVAFSYTGIHPVIWVGKDHDRFNGFRGALPLPTEVHEIVN